MTRKWLLEGFKSPKQTGSNLQAPGFGHIAKEMHVRSIPEVRNTLQK